MWSLLLIWHVKGVYRKPLRCEHRGGCVLFRIIFVVPERGASRLRLGNGIAPLGQNHSEVCSLRLALAIAPDIESRRSRVVGASIRWGNHGIGAGLHDQQTVQLQPKFPWSNRDIERRATQQRLELGVSLGPLVLHLLRQSVFKIFQRQRREGTKVLCKTVGLAIVREPGGSHQLDAHSAIMFRTVAIVIDDADSIKGVANGCLISSRPTKHESAVEERNMRFVQVNGISSGGVIGRGFLRHHDHTSL